MIESIVLGVIVIFSVGYLLLRNKSTTSTSGGVLSTFSNIEKAVLAKIADEEQKLLADFKAGKEDIIAEYERIKLRAESLVSLKAKLPVPVQVIASSPLTTAPTPTPTVLEQVVPQSVALAPVAAPVQQVVAAAPVIEAAPIAAPAPVIQPTEVQTV